jgi:LacI family transcriptional regulator
VNPLLGAALSAVRQRRHQHYRGTLALIDTAEPNPAQYLVFHQEIIRGAEKRARELGFQTELFWLGDSPNALSHRRVRQVLQARGITGVVFLPFNTARDLSDLDFGRLCAVQMDHCITAPRLHTVLPDHYMSMFNALGRLTNLGYRRIGLCLERRKDIRLHNKWTAAFESFFQGRSASSRIQPLVLTEITKDEVLRWQKRHQPDVIVGHVQAIVDWLRSAGVRIPADVGFFNLNMTERTGPCAGFELGPRRLAAVAVETVVAMLHRQEFGPPPFPQAIMLEAEWIEGPTLRGRPNES